MFAISLSIRLAILQLVFSLFLINLRATCSCVVVVVVLCEM